MRRDAGRRVDAPPHIAIVPCRRAQPFPTTGNMELFWNPFVQKLAPIAVEGNRAAQGLQRNQKSKTSCEL